MNGVDLKPPIFVTPFQSFDRDAGVISVPNDNVYTNLITLVTHAKFWLVTVLVGGYDAPLPNVVRWQLAIDGVSVFPWFDQRIVGNQLMTTALIGRLIYPNRTIQVQARIPASAAGAFDVVGRIVGVFVR